MIILYPAVKLPHARGPRGVQVVLEHHVRHDHSRDQVAEPRAARRRLHHTDREERKKENFDVVTFHGNYSYFSLNFFSAYLENESPILELMVYLAAEAAGDMETRRTL